MDLNEPSELAVLCDQCNNISENYYTCSYCNVSFEFNLLYNPEVFPHPCDKEVARHPDDLLYDKKAVLHPVDEQLFPQKVDDQVALNQPDDEGALQVAAYHEGVHHPADQVSAHRLRVGSEEAENESKARKRDVNPYGMYLMELKNNCTQKLDLKAASIS